MKMKLLWREVETNNNVNVVDIDVLKMKMINKGSESHAWSHLMLSNLKFGRNILFMM